MVLDDDMTERSSLSGVLRVVHYAIKVIWLEKSGQKQRYILNDVEELDWCIRGVGMKPNSTLFDELSVQEATECEMEWKMSRLCKDSS